MLTIEAYLAAMRGAIFQRETIPEPVRVAMLGLCYFLIGTFTIRFTRFDGGVAFVSAATAVLLAELTVTPPDRWKSRLAICWIAGAVMTAVFGLGAASAIPLASASIGEAAGVAWLLRRYCPGIGEFRSLAEVGIFLAIAGVAGPATTAFLGAACATAATGTAYWPNWINWYTGHALGATIFAPLLILSLRGEAMSLAREAGRRGVIEAVGLLSIVAATTVLVFTQSGVPLLFLPFLPMMIAVFRLGRFGAVTSSAIVALAGSCLTIKGMGPIALIDAGIGARTEFFQFYLAVAVLMVLPAAAELKRRKDLFAALQETSILHQLILDRTSDVIMKLEIDGTIAYVSPSIDRLTGYSHTELIGRRSHDLIFEDDAAAVVRVHGQALASPNETFKVEYRAKRDGGALSWFETHTRATVDEANRPTGVVSIIREISQRKQLEAELEHLASRDGLTGLANRRVFDSALSERIETGGNSAALGCVAIFDLDRFKTINDRFGHATGDEVLRQFAGIVASTVRSGDIAARYGGEEFVVLLADTSLQQAFAVCERIRSRLEATAIHARDGRRVFTTVSAGIAPVTGYDAPEHVLRSADDALYRAKAEGRNRLGLAA